jgi:hypothetical protein
VELSAKILPGGHWQALLRDIRERPDRPPREVILANRLIIRQSSGGPISLPAHPGDD